MSFSFQRHWQQKRGRYVGAVIMGVFLPLFTFTIQIAAEFSRVKNSNFEDYVSDIEMEIPSFRLGEVPTLVFHKCVHKETVALRQRNLVRREEAGNEELVALTGPLEFTFQGGEKACNAVNVAYSFEDQVWFYFSPLRPGRYSVSVVFTLVLPYGIEKSKTVESNIFYILPNDDKNNI